MIPWRSCCASIRSWISSAKALLTTSSSAVRSRTRCSSCSFRSLISSSVFFRSVISRIAAITRTPLSDWLRLRLISTGISEPSFRSPNNFFRSDLEFRLFSLRDIPDRGDHEDAVIRLARAQADFDRNLGAVLPETEQFHPHSHPTDVRIGELGPAVLRMFRPKPLRQEKFEVAPEQLLARKPEEPLGLGVHQADASRPVHDP